MTDYAAGYIGTYTEGAGGKARGVYSFVMNTATGVIEDFRLAAESVNPSWLVLSPGGKFLYAANETASFEGRSGSGGISAFAAGEDGGLVFLNSRRSGGRHPCHLAVNREGDCLVAANYSSGVISVFPLDERGFAGGCVQTIRLAGNGPVPGRQEKAHAHSFMFDKDYRYGFACDLGSDKIMAYRFERGAPSPLVPASPPFFGTTPGAGPRHGIFFPSGTFAYYLNELSSTVDVLRYDLDGRFKKIQSVSALPPKKKGKNIPSIAAAVRVSCDGRFLYASNRGHDSISLFKIKKSGVLEFVEASPSGGRHPRDFIMDPEGGFLIALNKDSDNIVIFGINRSTGRLKKLREYPALSPVSIIFR
ncbi:MAG: lactonase family protein [Treponema sp.]|jgi:6-phosphogluconolactonase|nr:lactonase family protein [Treponema sp.]